MSRIKVSLICIGALILLISVLVACAPAATQKPATTTPPATPATPATQPAPSTTPAQPATQPTTPATPPSPPVQQPPATPAAPPKTSYQAKTYTNDQYGFIFLYPSSMIAAATPKAKYNVFEAADAMAVPAVGVSILDAAKVDDETAESLASVGGTGVKKVDSQDITLADGKTKATLTKLTWKSTGYDIVTYGCAVTKGDKVISVSYTSLDAMIDPAVAREVVTTLTFK